ncbi:hypothetical protein SISNIDRAFT_480654 [Sistotremastrum niveocremeum HHB9708]|uniref:Voltage-gated hydrogen channel 1 n=2 Tax=Sistotremastraceae TaxID=3402574 RepID=A0A165AIV5_9AGAM|nr:hypothetical protein SISNIDRAFT_480654 [Sistotremastrum niveocremeum HHB9708]KZT44039.1 hypothetical protein SISSUDRAFT_1057045 [Sistotremastrum suecicum HHB10207 ss-3]
MSEQQPLLAGATSSSYDVENAEVEPEPKSWNEWVGEKLESRRLHKFVITLIVIDAICVLADLSWSFLYDPCESPEDEDPLWLDVLSHISLVITTLFLIEIPFTLFAFGPVWYNPLGPVLHAHLHLFDAFVIVVTFVLEAVLRGKERELAGLLIILRLWRLIKLVGGVAVGAGELTEETQKELLSTKVEVKKLRAELQEARDENEQLKSRLLRWEGVTSA